MTQSVTETLWYINILYYTGLLIANCTSNASLLWGFDYGILLAKWFISFHLPHDLIPALLVIFIITIMTNIQQTSWYASREWSIFMYSSFSSSIFIRQSLITSCSSPSPFILCPWYHVLCLFLLSRKARAHPPLLLKSTWAWHIHLPATRLLIEDWLQPSVVKGFITEEVGVGPLLRRHGLVTGGLGRCCGGAFLLLCKRVKVWAKGVGWSGVLGASTLPLWQECLPPWAPLCHVWVEGGYWATTGEVDTLNDPKQSVNTFDFAEIEIQATAFFSGGAQLWQQLSFKGSQHYPFYARARCPVFSHLPPPKKFDLSSVALVK